MGRRAEVREAVRFYTAIPIEEMTPLERAEPGEAPSAVWAAWLVLVLVVVILIAGSSDLPRFDMSVDGSVTPPVMPELIGP